MNKKRAKQPKKFSWSNFLLLLILLVGVGIMSYPTVSDWWNAQHSSQAIASYVEQVEQLEDTQKLQMLEEARAYNEAHSDGINFLLSEEEYAKYEKILDVSGTGIMGYIEIPSIHVFLPIYHGVSELVLQSAVGHIPGSSFPIGGKGTHAVLSGHRGLPSAKLFTDLDQVKEGDVFTVTVLGNLVTYQVDQIHVVLPEEVGDLVIDPNEDYVTLVTCTPYGINTHRMLVRGHRIDNILEQDEIVITTEAMRVLPIYVMLWIALPLILISLFISFSASFKMGKEKTQEQILTELEGNEDKQGVSDEKK